MSEATTTEYTTPDEQAILRAGQELDLMINTSGLSPIECLRRVFVPVLEQVRAGVKTACPSIPPTVEGEHDQLVRLQERQKMAANLIKGWEAEADALDEERDASAHCLRSCAAQMKVTLGVEG
jgi:hypothetical protein